MAFDVEGARKAGYSDQEIADHLAQQQGFAAAGARAAGYGDSDIIGHLAQAQAANLPTFDKQPAGAASRFVRGLAEPVIGLGQLFAHGAAGAAQALPQGNAFRSALEQNAQTYDEFTNPFLQRSAEMAPAGMDWARLAGNAVPLIVGTAGIGAPAGMAGLAGAGAVAGGLSGAPTPVDTTQGGFAAEKGLQTAGGAAAGAVLGPVAAKALGAAGDITRRVFTSLRGSPPTPQTPQQIRILLQQELTQRGIDPTQVPAAWLQQQADDVARALAAGGSTDMNALANQATFQQLGLRGTQGQITQDPTQFSKEVFLRQAAGGAPLAQQYNQTLASLGRQLSDIGRGAAPASNQTVGTAGQAFAEHRTRRGPSHYGACRRRAGTGSTQSGRPTRAR